MPIEGHKFRIVVITQGSDDVILVDEAGVVHEIPVMKISDDQVTTMLMYSKHMNTGCLNTVRFLADFPS